MMKYFSLSFLLLWIFLTTQTEIFAQTINTTKVNYRIGTTIGQHENAFDFNIPKTGNLILKPKYTDRARRPFHRHFWQFNDGGFSFDSIPRHRFDQGSFYPTVQVLKVYDDDDDPPDERPMPIPSNINPNSITTKLPNPKVEMEGKPIRLIQNFDAKPGDDIICVLTYEKSCASSFTTGNISFSFPDDLFTYKSTEIFNGETNFSSVTTGTTSPITTLTWSYSFQASEVEQRNIFIKLNTNFDLTNIGKIANFGASISITGDPPGNLCVPPSNTNFNSKIVKSHDPNNKTMIVQSSNHPLCNNSIYTIDSRIDFQNTGAGPTDTIIVQDFIHEDLDPYSIVFLQNQSKFPLIHYEYDPATRLATWLFDNTNLRGTGEPGYGTAFTPQDTKGWLSYKITTNYINYECQAIFNQAFITFDCNEPIPTDVAILKIGCNSGALTNGCDQECYEILNTSQIDSLQIIIDTLADGTVSVDTNNINISAFPYSLDYNQWYPTFALDLSNPFNPVCNLTPNPYPLLNHQNLIVPDYYMVSTVDCERFIQQFPIYLDCDNGLRINTVVSTNCNASNISGKIKAWVTDASNSVYSNPTWFDCSSTDTLCINNLAPGTYEISFVDQNGCPKSKEVVIPNPPPLWIDPDYNNCNLSLKVLGGTPPYNYSWSNGSTNSSINLNAIQLPATVYVTDALGCQTSYSTDSCATPSSCCNCNLVQNFTFSGTYPNYNFQSTATIDPSCAIFSTYWSQLIPATDTYIYLGNGNNINAQVSSNPPFNEIVVCQDITFIDPIGSFYGNTFCKTISGGVTWNDCDPVIDLDDLILTSGTIKAANSILSSGLIPSNENVSFKAGQNVILEQEFQIDANVNFNILIEDCNIVPCWDGNGNGLCDTLEDLNGDGICNQFDCLTFKKE